MVSVCPWGEKPPSVRVPRASLTVAKFVSLWLTGRGLHMLCGLDFATDLVEFGRDVEKSDIDDATNYMRALFTDGSGGKQRGTDARTADPSVTGIIRA